ncbi:hypothetical protein Bca4012_093366 [Brassica carinata]
MWSNGGFWSVTYNVSVTASVFFSPFNKLMASVRLSKIKNRWGLIFRNGSSKVGFFSSCYCG